MDHYGKGRWGRWEKKEYRLAQEQSTELDVTMSDGRVLNYTRKGWKY